MRITKHQIPITKEIPITNIQTPFGYWEIDHWLLFGAWDLVIDY